MNIFRKAEEIIHGDRERTYGDPGINLRRIASFWNAYLSNKTIDNDEFVIDEDDVAMMMVLLKIARQQHEYKEDNLIDAAGYLGLIERMHPSSRTWQETLADA